MHPGGHGFILFSSYANPAIHMVQQQMRLITPDNRLPLFGGPVPMFWPMRGIVAESWFSAWAPLSVASCGTPDKARYGACGNSSNNTSAGLVSQLWHCGTSVLHCQSCHLALTSRINHTRLTDMITFAGCLFMVIPFLVYT